LKQPAHRPLLRLIGSKLVQFELEGFEGLETWVLA